jgi:putative tryptophan/tyrosine transport system substrate-binding protein
MKGRSRRQFLRGVLALVGVGLLSGCGSAAPSGQQPAKVPVIGFLATGPRQGRAHLVAAFIEGLRDLGYVEGRTIAIEYRFADRNDQLPALAAELVSLPVDIILASATTASFAAKEATSTIPIVMGGSGDPVGTGLVPSLAHPGGNVTGLSNFTLLSEKRLELLREIIPGLSRVLVFSNDASPLHVPQEADIQAAGQKLGVDIRILPVRRVDEFEGAFQAAARAGADAVYLTADSLVTNEKDRIAELALRYRLPSVFDFSENAYAGGFLSYGPSIVDNYRRSAAYVDKILRGARPAELPIEQPMKFDLVINLKTAQALGLTIPQPLLRQTTGVVQ